MNQYEQSIFVYAARHAHHRNTGAAIQVVDAILNHWNELSEQTREQLQKEAREATYNLDYWARLIKR